MENTTAKKKNSKSAENKADKIKEAYIDYLLGQGEPPSSIYQFVKSLNMKEGEFYEHYNSFAAIEKEIWQGFFEETMARVKGENVYNEYSVREKLLAFYYTWIEVLKNNRSYVVFSYKSADRVVSKIRTPQYKFLNAFKHEFLRFANELISEGKETGEIVNRPLISRRYDEGLWRQLLFILKYWVEDDSRNFEQTDAAIEKAVNLSFDIMGRSAVDTAIDFAKFLFQKK